MEKSSSWFRDSVTVKLVIIGIITVILLIPGSMIQSLIYERESTRDTVIGEINSLWGNAQTITGPFISVPYKVWIQRNNEKVPVIEYAHFLPDKLNISGEITPEIRYRGIYKVIVYNSVLDFTGRFGLIDPDQLEISQEDFLWDQAMICVGIPDMRGINKEINMQFGGKSYELNPGIPVKDIVASGVSCKPEITGNKEFEFSFTLDINGSQSLNFLPVGKNTNVSLHSSWSNPSFSGSYLPDNREIGPDGFSADWNILHLNRNYPQQWTGSSYSIGESAFGLNLLFPVDQYQKSNRAVKYAIMFIALTFISFFFSETLRKIRIHPMQYLLVGFALIIFFSLLISLSEYVGFGYAYLISGSMIVAMITLYYYSLVKNIRATAIISLIMVTLYLFLFTILQLQDYSLIMGSIGLFVILAVVMFLSRKIDWYAPLNRQGE